MENELFKVHKLNENGLKKAAEIAEAFSEFHEKISSLALVKDVPCSTTSARCLAILSTKLEEASFFAKKAMAQQPHNQE